MATGVNTRQGSRRLLEFAFEHAVATGRKKVAIVHKANIMKALTGIFLETGQELYERKYKGRFTLETVIIDACAMKLVLNPWQFDVLVTTNLFGDILSDLVAGLVGGLGMTPGANIGTDAAIFEAVHGSAPDIAGKGIANPIALLLAAAMMLEHCHLPHMAARLRTAIDQTLNVDKVRTGDLGGTAEHRGIHPRAGQAHRPCLKLHRGASPHESRHIDQQRHQILCLGLPGPEAHQSRDRQGRDLRAARPERRRQDHADQHHLRHRHARAAARVIGGRPRHRARLSRRPNQDRPGAAGTEHRRVRDGVGDGFLQPRSVRPRAESRTSSRDCCAICRCWDKRNSKIMTCPAA